MAALVAGGCAPATEEAPASEPRVEEHQAHPERRGIGLAPLPEPTGVSAQAVMVDPRRSLAVTDQYILDLFSFQAVMDQLVAQSGVPGLTSLQLFRQWWDTARPTSSGLGLGPNCDSMGVANLNGFPYTCPRAEGDQAMFDPFISPSTNPNAYVAIGLFNRFDLAPTSGTDCGEYRIVFAKRSGLTSSINRNFLIFEAVLPNPNPSQGLEGCRPVANFWRDLTTDPSPGSRGLKLRDFYFQGLPGFLPVLHVDNLGNRTTGAATGQVRTNQFMQSSWTLREFKLRKECAPGACLRFIPVTDKTNPGGALFNPFSAHPLRAEFQGTSTSTSFPNQVSSLALNDINRFSMVIADKYNSGQSNAQGSENNYVLQLGTGASSFRGNIQNQLFTLGSTLSPDQVVERAMTQSCAGCHQLSNGRNLGGGLIWPSSLGFVHVSEQSPEPSPEGGSRFRISGALTGTFLPHRQQVLESFLNSSCGDGVCSAWESGSTCATDCGGTVPPGCTSRSQGSTSSCKDSATWQGYASEDCMSLGMMLSSYTPREACSETNYRYVDYLCCK